MPSSSDHEHDDENHHHHNHFDHHSGRKLNFKRLCTKNVKEDIDEDETKKQEDEDDEEDDREKGEENDDHNESQQHKLNEIHQGGNQSESSGYKCTHCNIIFTEYPLYSIHAGMHSCKNPWQCSVCGHTCANKIDFNVHILHLSKI